MSITDKILLEWSYRCEKGYPDIDSAKDWVILEQILKELGTNLDTLDEAFRQFKYSELVKPGRERRAETIASKIAQGTEFELYPSGTTKLQFTDPSYAEVFASRDVAKIKQIGGTNVNKFPFFKDEQGTEYGLDSLAKTPELPFEYTITFIRLTFSVSACKKLSNTMVTVEPVVTDASMVTI